MSQLVLSPDTSEGSSVQPSTSSGPTNPVEPPLARRRLVEGEEEVPVAAVPALEIESSREESISDMPHDVESVHSVSESQQDDAATLQYISSSSAPSSRSKPVSVASSSSQRRRALQEELKRAKEEEVRLRIERLQEQLDRESLEDVLSQSSQMSHSSLWHSPAAVGNDAQEHDSPFRPRRVPGDVDNAALPTEASVHEEEDSDSHLLPQITEEHVEVEPAAVQAPTIVVPQELHVTSRSVEDTSQTTPAFMQAPVNGGPQTDAVAAVPDDENMSQVMEDRQAAPRENWAPPSAIPPVGVAAAAAPGSSPWTSHCVRRGGSAMRASSSSSSGRRRRPRPSRRTARSTKARSRGRRGMRRRSTGACS